MQELTSFKEDYRRFQKMEAEILAISADDLVSHQGFSLGWGGYPSPC